MTNTLSSMRALPPRSGAQTPGSNRDHHAGLEPGGFCRKNQKSRVVIAKADVVAHVVGKESRESMGCNLVPCQRVNVAGGSAWTYGSERGLLRIPDNSEYLRNFTLRGPDLAGAREVAPITIDARDQFDQDQVAILRAPPGRLIKSPCVGAVRAGLHHGSASGMKYFIAANLPVEPTPLPPPLPPP